MIFSRQTVKVSGIALQDSEMFSHVALSRCGENRNITILCDKTRKTKKHCVPTGLDKNWHGLIVKKNFFVVVNTTVISNIMYRDNPLAFWSETIGNSLNRHSYPWKLQTAKLNYNLLKFRSKTAGNSLYYINSSLQKQQRNPKNDNFGPHRFYCTSCTFTLQYLKIEKEVPQH